MAFKFGLIGNRPAHNPVDVSILKRVQRMSGTSVFSAVSCAGLTPTRRRIRRRTTASPTNPVASKPIEAGSGAGVKVKVALFNVNVEVAPLTGAKPSTTLIDRLFVGVNEADTRPPAAEAFSEPLAPPLYVRQDAAPVS